ncbi:MAG: hypothetical protein MJZ17_00225 [Bacteroidales bacterium]|nr:hypothetical protein [Bacteroidales bacterium]
MKKIETREHVQAFLNSFLPKFDIWGIFFIDRKKNDEAIAALGITPAQRADVIRNIETDTICISFHKSEFPNKYAFKERNK